MQIPRISPRWVQRAGGVAAALALAACGGSDGGEPLPPEPLAFTDVEVQAFSGVAEPRTVAVNDGLGWSALWTAHTSNVAPAPVRPAVAFEAQAVAAVFLGKQTGCQRPVIDEVERTPALRIVVHYRVAAPGPAELCPPVIMTPAHMVRFANADRLPVEFRQR